MNIASWSVDVVCSQLALRGVDPAVVESFRENQVDGHTLMGLNRQDLKEELGLTSITARKETWEVIEAILVESQDGTHASGAPRSPSRMRQLRRSIDGNAPASPTAGSAEADSLSESQKLKCRQEEVLRQEEILRASQQKEEAERSMALQERKKKLLEEEQMRAADAAQRSKQTRSSVDVAMKSANQSLLKKAEEEAAKEAALAKAKAERERIRREEEERKREEARKKEEEKRIRDEEERRRMQAEEEKRIAEAKDRVASRRQITEKGVMSSSSHIDYPEPEPNPSGSSQLTTAALLRHNDAMEQQERSQEACKLDPVGLGPRDSAFGLGATVEALRRKGDPSYSMVKDWKQD